MSKEYIAKPESLVASINAALVEDDLTSLLSSLFSLGFYLQHSLSNPRKLKEEIHAHRFIFAKLLPIDNTLLLTLRYTLMGAQEKQHKDVIEPNLRR